MKRLYACTALVMIATLLLQAQSTVLTKSTVLAKTNKLGATFPVLNPGWQFVQEFTPNNCSGTSCTTPSDCSVDNCLVPTTIGDVVAITLVAPNSNITITSVTGAGTGWTNASCQSFQSGLSDLDMEYTLSATTSFQGITVNASGSTTSAYLDIVELRPPNGFSAQFDGCASKVNTSCTTCTGAAPSVTGTDAIVQVPNFNSGGFTNPATATPFSSPYYSNYEGDAVCVNCTSATAPTFQSTPSAPMNIIGFSFKTNAGNFISPSKIFSIANYSLPTLASVATCSPTCSITINSTGTGNLLFLTEEDSSGSSGRTITSVSGAGTWVVNPTGCHQNQGAGQDREINCAYNLSSTSGVTSLSVTITGNASNVLFAVWEISRNDSNLFTLDTSGGTLNSGVANSIAPGVALTLANTRPHVTFQAITARGNTDVGVDGATFYPSPFAGGPNGTVLSNADAAASNAVLLNDTQGTAPSWPFPGGDAPTTTTPVFGISFY